ncbi:DUF4377 domain-containing protein [Gramella sp. KN1008]|nr:DUF4377 domain-containing protein [Gramella sp. KN1008]
MRINHFRQTGIGEGLHLVYLVQESEEIGGGKWSFFYDEIEGFDYELGYIYDLKVRKVEIENPPLDGSAVKYILVNVRSKEKAPANVSFDINLKNFGHSFITEHEDGPYLLYQYKIDCSNMCESLQSEIESKEIVTGTFFHGPDESLILHSLK